MKSDKETKVKLLESARQEFMEKGYMQASLRSICKNAGVTTGALYFFFKDKEDLFDSLVAKPLSELHEIMSSHYQSEIEELQSGQPIGFDYTEDEKTAVEIVHFMYQYYNEFILLLTKAQGSSHENCIDQFVNDSEQHYRIFADAICEQNHRPKVDDYTIHWMAHMQTDIFVHMITHEPSEQAALAHMKFTVEFILHGWWGMLKLK